VITRFTANNYGPLREVAIDLSPLTVLVGPNGSGKSTVLRALNVGNRDFPIWQHQDLEATLTAQRSDGSLLVGRSKHSTPPPWSDFKYQVAQLDPRALRSDNSFAKANSLGPEGSNLVNVFASLSRRDQGELARQFCTLVPTFSDVNIEPVGGGQARFSFRDRWSPTVSYGPSEVSDGTMIVLAYVCLQWQLERPDLLAIEEPERGLHPYLIEQVVRLLRAISIGEVGPKPTQVIIATHSPALLEFVRPEEVRFLSRDPNDGGVKVEQVDTSAEGWEDAFKEYRESLGEAWLSGGLGGVP
jgi:predicted ATPase